ncbi:MAG: anti-repressor SinI family protein [Eubacterium sp.]|nr:anti-repressor SinI family protein [Eubacterium sp.]
MEHKHVRSEQEWMELIQECRASGLSDKEWCLQHSIPVSTFYNKITILRKKACVIPESCKNGTHAPQEIVPVQIIETAGACMDAGGPVRDSAVHVPAVALDAYGHRVEIANHAARDTVLNVLSVLRQLC